MTLVTIELNKQTHKEIAGSNPVVSISSRTLSSYLFFFFISAPCEYLFFLHYNPQTPSCIRTPPPWVRHTPWSHHLLSPQVHSKHNHQMSTPRYKHSGTHTSSFFFYHPMYPEWYTPHGSTIYVPIYGTLSGTHIVPFLYHLYRHVVSDSSNGLWWEHLLGQHTHTVSADVPHPQVPLRI